MPDSEQDKIVGAHFQDLWAKPFESLAARNPKMEMFHFPCSVGVNNLECKTWEEEQDVLPGSHVSDDIVNCPTKRRRGGCWDGHMLQTQWAQSRRFSRESNAETNVVWNTHVWLKHYSFVIVLLNCCCDHC